MGNHLRKIQYKKQFFIKSFIVSVVLMIIVTIISIMGNNFFSGLAERFYNIDQDEYSNIVVSACALWKLLIIQFTLVPAIAMSMLEKRVKADEVMD